MTRFELALEAACTLLGLFWIYALGIRRHRMAYLQPVVATIQAGYFDRWYMGEIRGSMRSLWILR